jgi:GntR family transcriptional repressor for pyruvate dehydrogenase complex
MVIDKLQRVNQTRIFEYASDQIRQLIQDGQLKPGEKLPTEQELCNALDMGRSSIREAIRVLEAEGLIEVRRGAGTYVTAKPQKLLGTIEAVDWLKPRKESLLQILQIRQCIECLTVQLVAQFRPEELITELEQLIAKLAELVEKDEHEIDFGLISEVNMDFHLAISKASGNDIAYEFLRHLLSSFSESNKAVISIEITLNHQISEHQAILDAIKAGDCVLAEQTMRAHLDRVIKEVKQINR